MAKTSKTQLLTSSAIAGIAILQFAPAVQAQENFGIRNQQPELLEVVVDAGESVEGNIIGVFGDTGPIAVTNNGSIRGNGFNGGSLQSLPGGGVVIAQGGSSVTNLGDISGAQFGITTISYLDPATGQFESRAIGTTVVNSGSISGEQDDGVRLIGGGVVQNSGTISGTGSAFADGISMFPFADQANENYAALVENGATGSITGQRFGVILSAGGDVTNDGTITGGTGGVLIQGTALNVAEGEDRSGLTASVTNTGTISGTGDFGFGGTDGYGVGFGGDLATATLVNSGTITSAFNRGVLQGSSAALTITNEATGTIEGATSGIYSTGGSLTVINAGVIRGNGTYDGFDASPDAGITIASAGSSVTNSGTISGAGGGITTAFAFNTATSELLGLAVGTVVTNSGTIAGESNDGVRLIGGGSVVNSGTISGTGGALADGISMFAYTDQAIENYSASVENAAGGTITGQRFGIILSGGGDVSNDGTITGGNGGVLMQSGPFNLTGGAVPPGQTATVTNTGTINATGDFGVNGILGYGVGFAGALETASLVNSGTITSAFNAGVRQGSAAALAITNEATGIIEGASSGVVVSAGNINLSNAGTIRGDGTSTGTSTAFEGGIRLQAGANTIANSGTISGAQFGIVTTQLFNTATQTLEWQVGRTQITNSGSIIGDVSDGILLLAGGSVVNSGTIRSGAGIGADGIQLQFIPGQDSGLPQIGSIVNEAGGTITGDRYGVILAGGGTITNAGVISGNTNGALLVSQNRPGKTGALDNSGTITGGVLIDLASALVSNTGTITNATGIGFLSEGGSVQFTNAGQISGNGVAIQFSAADDQLTLLTGSRIQGLTDGGEGFDSLVLDGDVLELSAAQELGDVTGFESLAITAGYWNKTGSAGTFDSVVIGDGAALQINEAAVAGQAPVSSLVAPAITNNGRLVLNFSDDAALTQLAGRPISGTGALQLIGEGVLTVAGNDLTHTGGTTVSNGGLVLTGTLPGDVTTEGDGFFQLGNGGTEGTFAGNLVNNGRFIFNRSGDYDFVGNFSGSGVLDKLGTGVLVFLGDYDFRGTTNIFAGSVRIAGVIDPTTEFNLGSGGTLDISGNDQTIAALSGEEEARVELGSQILSVTQQENTTFAGTITGTGGLVKDGDGLLNLTGDSTFTGPTAVNGGTLAVNGSIISPVTVNEGGTLGGNGSVGSATVTSGGAIAPGNSIGRLTVNGDLAFGAGSIYEVEVNAAGQADRIDATGRVTIASTAQMAILAENGTYAPRTDYVVLTGAQGVTGTFGTVTTDLAFLTPFLRYDANAVTLSLYRNDISFAAVAANPNQAGVAGAIQALGINNPLFETVLVQNAATAQATFADLSGEIHASTIAGLTDDSRHLRNAMLGMAAPQQSGAFLWGSAFGSWGEFDSSASNFGMQADHRGFVTGVGYGGEGFGIAVSAGLGGSDFALDGRADASDVSSTYLALHGSFVLPGGFRGAAGVSYAWHDVVTNRAVGGALAQSLTASRDAKTWQLFGEVGYTLALGSTAITPFARLAHVSTDSDGFTEVGGNAALTVGDVDQKTTFLSLGARAEFGAADAKLKPYASAAWNRAFGDRNAAAVSRLTGNAPAFTVSGLTIPQDSAELEAGLSYTAGRLNLGAGYVGMLAGDRNTHGARLTARFSF